MHTVIFSHLWFVCILLLEELFVQLQTLQQQVPGPRDSQHWGLGDQIVEGVGGVVEGVLIFTSLL